MSAVKNNLPLYAHKIATCLKTSFNFTREGRRPDAVKLLQKYANDPFTHAYLESLHHPDAANKSLTIFKQTRPFDIWCRTQFAQQEEAGYIKAMQFFTSQSRCRPPASWPCIVDIGTGNGVLLCKLVNSLVKLHQLQGIQLVLVDSSKSMLQAAKKRCKTELTAPHRVNLTGFTFLVQSMS